jgi:hypothetical protein
MAQHLSMERVKLMIATRTLATFAACQSHLCTVCGQSTEAEKVDVGDDLLTDPVCLILTVDDWNVTESVSACEDGFVEDTENHVITRAVASDDARYNDIFVIDVAALRRSRITM